MSVHDQLKRDQLAHDAGILRELTHTEYWDILVRYLDTMTHSAYEQMLSSTREDFDYLKGVIMGYRDVLALPSAVERDANASS